VSSTAPSATPSTEAAPATRPGALARAPVLYLYSGDDTLLLELGPMLGVRYRTRPIDSTEQIAPPGGGPWALLIDATARSDARAQAARVKQQYPQAPLLVVCADGAAVDWAGPRSRGTVCAVVERQAITGPEFEAALEAVDRQLGQAASAEVIAAPAARGMAVSWPMRIALASAALAAAAATWYFLHGAPGMALRPDAPRSRGTVSQSTSTALPAAPAPAPAGRPVVELLSDARVAFSEERRQLPPADAAATGNSALELYARVLAQDPRNEEARDGMRRLFAVATTRVRSDLAAGHFDDASRLLAIFAGQGIADDAVTALQAELAAARPRWLATQARAAIAAGDVDGAARLMAQLAASGADRATLGDLQQSMASQQADARLVALARRVRAAINAGALIEPATDGAQALVQQMQQLNRDHPLTAAAQQELQAALAERSRLQQQAEAARARAAAPAPAPAIVPPLTPAPAAPADDFLAARPVAPLDVSYPQRAFEAGQKGYVIVEFTLDATGRATNAHVVESSPPAVFDAAALQAVRRGRFDPSALGVPAKPQRARLRISFKP
jgi:TonB family protein